MDATQAEPSTRRPRKIRKWPIILGLFLVAAAAGVKYLSSHLAPAFRARALEVLREHYQSDVELKSLDISLFPIIVRGEGLALYIHGRTDLPPLVSVKKFTLKTHLIDILTGPRRVHNLRLEGLKITVSRGAHRTQPAPATPRKIPKFVIDDVLADGTVLEIIPAKEGKEPLVFELSKLALQSAGVGQPMKYQATLTNAKPPGMIDTKGTFGPWQVDDPIETPVSGSYNFSNANLAVFKGISGILASTGRFDGRLSHIETQGTTDTPDFRLSISGHPVDLKTEFHSIVDGGDGDTLLQPVKARFRNTPIIAKGGVTGVKGVPGKTVALDLIISGGRLEDLLWLALKSSKPFVVGRLDFRTRFVLPPGDQDVVQKLKLNGSFHVSDAKFKTVEVQDKLNNLSHRAEGRPQDVGDGEEVVSDLHGRFVLDHSVMNFSELSFGVPGARIRLAGRYGLADETIDFHGTARIQATLSQMTTGFKSVLLKAVDPFFRKNGAGTLLPIKITGTREHPSFGLEFRRKDKEKDK
jgi:hypothetical protein